MAIARSSTSSIDRLFELSVDMLGTASLDGYFTLLNPAWQETLGWRVESLMAWPFISFVHPDDVEATVHASEQLATPGTTPIIGFENRYRMSGGGYRALQWNSVAADGIVYFVAHDITTQRAEREKLRMQEQSLLDASHFLTGVTDNMAEGMFALDDAGRVTFVNSAAEMMLGWS